MVRRDDFRVVLVEPEESKNVGSVARAMANLGFRHLHLVAPQDYYKGRARATAHHAGALIDAAVIHTRFEDALADVQEAVAFSGRSATGRLHAVESLPEWAAGLAPEGGSPSRCIALVFGSEGNGLRQEHLDLCARTVRIPAPGEYPSFNLAQAVLIALWEINRVLPEDTLPPEPEPEDLPTGNDFAQLDRLLDAVMRESGFLRTGTPTPVPGTLRHLLRRTHPDRREMGILIGLFGRIDRELRRLRRQQAGEDS